MPRHKTTIDLDWHGSEIEARFNRAIGRATISLGEGVVYYAKSFVDVESGDLRRSIHPAVNDTGGERDANAHNVLDHSGAILEAGSWLDYACVEEVGRHHQFMHPAIEAVRPLAQRTFREAFRQEGF